MHVVPTVWSLLRKDVLHVLHNSNINYFCDISAARHVLNQTVCVCVCMYVSMYICNKYIGFPSLLETIYINFC